MAEALRYVTIGTGDDPIAALTKCEEIARKAATHGVQCVSVRYVERDEVVLFNQKPPILFWKAEAEFVEVAA